MKKVPVVKRTAIAALIATGMLGSLTSSALPVPPPNGGGWLIYTYYAAVHEDGVYEPVGVRYQGGCPGPQPMPWGVTTSRFTYAYVACGGGQN